MADLRFHPFVVIEDRGYDTPCLIWTGPTDGSDGYGADWDTAGYSGGALIRATDSAGYQTHVRVRIDNLPPGQERLLSYGIDLQMKVDATKNKSDSTIQTGRIRQYVMFIVIGAIAIFALISFFWSPTLAR